MKEFSLSTETVWPKELLYFRRMSSTELSQYIENTPEQKRLVLIVWGVLESHGPYLPLASDSHLAAFAADAVAARLSEEEGIQPVIFDGWKDVGCPSATWEFPGAIGFTSSPTPIVHEIWKQTLARLLREGFTKFFVVNGDGGNWMTHWHALRWDPDIRTLLQEHNATLEGANWDQEGGAPYMHGGTHEHALTTWACEYAPVFARLSAIRHGLKAPREEDLAAIDGTDHKFLEDEPYRATDWSAYKDQPHLRSVTEFSLSQYRALLYDANGSPRKEGGIAADFEAKIEHLMRKVRAMF